MIEEIRLRGIKHSSFYFLFRLKTVFMEIFLVIKTNLKHERQISHKREHYTTA